MTIKTVCHIIKTKKLYESIMQSIAKNSEERNRTFITTKYYST